jgi:hypothetical protein
LNILLYSTGAKTEDVTEKEPTSFDRLAAFQASISGVLLAVNEVGLMLTNEMLAEVRQLLDDNGFNTIQF